MHFHAVDVLELGIISVNAGRTIDTWLLGAMHVEPKTNIHIYLAQCSNTSSWKEDANPRSGWARDISARMGHAR
jgi:hypothetical protein